MNTVIYKGGRTRQCVSPKSRFAMLFLMLILASLLIPGGMKCAEAQTLYGSIVGNVSDATGAVIPGAMVKVTQTETNESRETTTNANGGYTLSTVTAGTYNVVITKEGLGTFQAKSISVTLNTSVRVDATLTVGSVSQSVTVSTETAQLQADRADVHEDVTSKALQELPQPTRTYQGVIGLMPGVAPPQASTGGTNNPMRSMEIQSNGTSASGTNVRVDGVSATNPWVQFYSTAVPSTDAIETVNVVTASSGADEGMVNGAAVNVQIKSGTNCTDRCTSITSTTC
jgi:hypothetical protein